MVHGKKRTPYWIDRRLTGLAGTEYHAIISFRSPIEPEDSQYGESRMKAHRRKKLNLGVLVLACKFVIPCCLLVAAVAGCGPSEREIEATFTARIQATETSATATAVANLPTPTPIVSSPTGLQLPSRLRREAFPVQALSLEEARKMYRGIGCPECSTTLDKRSGRLTAVEVMVGHFFGHDELPDSVVLYYRRDRTGGPKHVRFQFYGIPLRHSGVNLIAADQGSESYIRLWNNVYDPEWSARTLFHRVVTKAEPIVDGRAFDVATMRIHGDTFLFVIAALGGDENRAEANFDFIRFTPGNNGAAWSYSGFYSSDQERNRGHISEYWVGDFDDDDTAEVATIKDASIHRVIEIYERIKHNDEAADTIERATRDFASNLLTNGEDSVDFELLWREHGPSASVAALALVLDVSFHGLLDDLYAAVNEGRDIRETVLEIRESRR